MKEKMKAKRVRYTAYLIDSHPYFGVILSTFCKYVKDKDNGTFSVLVASDACIECKYHKKITKSYVVCSFEDENKELTNKEQK